MKNSGISWTDHTFNPWHGCEKVSPACTRCYAEALSIRWGRRKIWGKGVPRRFMSETYWKQPVKWNEAAAAAGTRARVFCASMADVFEDRRDLDGARRSLWKLIGKTPSLDWLLLTKRPENVLSMIPSAWRVVDEFPSNVWMGTTAENDEWWDKRVEVLRGIPARIRFVSVEPMLGPITGNLASVDWILVGGESGPGARLMEKAWAVDLLDRAKRAGIRVHYKQHGRALARQEGTSNPKGGDPAEWPADLRIQEFPVVDTLEVRP